MFFIEKTMKKINKLNALQATSRLKKNCQIEAFTIIEFLVTILIVGLLAGFAYPVYTKQVLKSRRVDVQAGLYSFAQAMERFYTSHQDYSAARLGSKGVFPNAWPKNSQRKFFKFKIDSSTSQQYYKISAHALVDTNQISDDCPILWLDSLGNTGAENEGKDVENCW